MPLGARVPARGDAELPTDLGRPSFLQSVRCPVCPRRLLRAMPRPDPTPTPDVPRKAPVNKSAAWPPILICVSLFALMLAVALGLAALTP